MARAQGFDADRVLAVCGVALAYALAAWLLGRTAPPATVPSTHGALQIVWIDPLPAPAQPPRVAPAPQQGIAPAAAPQAVKRAAAAAAPAPVPRMSAAPPASRPRSAEFLEQGRAWARAEAVTGDFVRDPLAASPPRDAAVRRDRFAMREATTPARIAAGIGTLFGGAGYDTDPCPRIDDNITALATGGPGELLDEELRRRRRLCR